MKKLLTLSLTAVAALAFNGCSDPAKYEDPNGNHTIVSLDKVNIQDFAAASDFLVQSLMSSEEFGKIVQAGKKPVVAVSSVRNDTSSQFDTDMLMQKINTALIKSRKVLISTTVGAGGRAPDQLARELRAADEFASGRDSVAQAPEYTISGKILEDRASAGSTRQTSYIFQLTLTDVRQGAAVWMDEKTVTKQGEKNSVGW